MVLIDSSIWIEASRRTGSLEVKCGIEGLLEAYEAALCSPVMLEVLAGARKEERKQLNTDFSCLPYIRATEADYLAAVRHAWKLKDAGISAPNTDILIATIALRLMCRVYAQDKHFEMMAPILGFSLYKPGYGGKYQDGEG